MTLLIVRMRATGTLDIAVVGVNETAFLATKNVVRAGVGSNRRPTDVQYIATAESARK